MSSSARRTLPWFVVLLAPAALSLGCSGGGGSTEGSAYGDFVVALKSDFPPAIADVTGTTKNAAPNNLTIWEQAAKDGSCALLKPRIPFCSTPCGSGNECVENDTCKAEPTGKDVGTVTVTGIKTSTGATEVQLSSTAVGSYGTATSLAYPPFDEGAEFSLSATGGDASAFSAKAKGIAPLVAPTAELSLEKDKPLVLTWTAKGAGADSTIHVHLDISHHGGSKGEIECDAADTGSLTIGATLVTQLVNLGVAGFPTVRLTRVSGGSTKVGAGTVGLRAEHNVERAIVVPGHVSCTEDTQCPTGQTCQTDLQCK